MNLATRSPICLECEHATVRELETYPRLERFYEYLNSSEYHITYRGNVVTMLDNYRICGNKIINNLKSLSEFYEVSIEDFNKLNCWNILDTPNCAKIILEDSIVPGILMTITMDGDNASLVFFPMAMCCAWSKDPFDRFFEEERVGRWHYLGRDFDWKERPFSEIESKFKKGNKIYFITIPNERTEYDLNSYREYFIIWET